MKFNYYFLTVLCSTFALTHASNTSADNPFNQYKNQILALATNTEKALNNKKGWTLDKLIQKGVCDSPIYYRLLLSEFYCARCAVGANVFDQPNLAQKKAYTTAVTNNNQPSPMLLPGGFDLSTIKSFVKKARSNVRELRKARYKFAPGTKSSVNPLETFAGVIVIPSGQFSTATGLGNIQIQNNIISTPQFFPYTKLNPTTVAPPQPTSTQNSTSTQSLTVASTSTLPQPATLSASESHNIQFTLQGSIQPTGDNTVTKGLCDLTLANYKSNVKRNGQDLPCYLSSISGTVGSTPVSISIFDKFRSPTTKQKELIQFFQGEQTPWALVIKLDGEITSKGVLITATIPAIVKLNPFEYWKYTKLNSTIDLATLIDMPNNLYYNIQNIEENLQPNQKSERTTTARLLRGIANGYLSSWSYKPIPGQNSNLTAWRTVGTNYTCYFPVYYSTPSVAQRSNNCDNYMFYALYGSKYGIKNSHLSSAGIPNIASIIQNPSQSINGYQVNPTQKPLSASTVIAELGGINQDQITLQLKERLLETQTALNQTIALSGLTSNQKNKLTQAKSALKKFVKALENNKNLNSSLKNLITTLSSAGGAVAWPYSSNRVLNTTTAKTFIISGLNFRATANSFIEEPYLLRSLPTDSELITQLKSQPKPTQTHAAAPSTHVTAQSHATAPTHAAAQHHVAVPTHVTHVTAQNHATAPTHAAAQHHVAAPTHVTHVTTQSHTTAPTHAAAQHHVAVPTHVTHITTQSHTTAQTHGAKKSIEAYKAGYKRGKTAAQKSIRAYKRGYRRGKTAAQRNNELY